MCPVCSRARRKSFCKKKNKKKISAIKMFSEPFVFTLFTKPFFDDILSLNHTVYLVDIFHFYLFLYYSLTEKW